MYHLPIRVYDTNEYVDTLAMYILADVMLLVEDIRTVVDDELVCYLAFTDYIGNMICSNSVRKSQ